MAKKDLGADVSLALKRPFEDIETAIIGIILSFIPIVNFFFFGFVIENIRATLKRKALPEWKDWGEKFIDGLKYFIVGLVYTIIPTILILLGMWSGLKSVKIGGPLKVYGLIFGSSIATIGFILLIILGYFLSAAIIRMAEKRKIGAAFELGYIARKAITGEYFVHWLVANILNGIIGLLLSFIPIIGWIIAGYYMAIFGTTLMALGYQKA